MELYGRDDEVKRLRESQSKVVVVTGDSGVGKSSLLDAARDADLEVDEPSCPVVLHPVPLLQSSGSLQRAVLETLGEAVGILASDETLAQTVANNLWDATARLVDIQATDVAKAVGQVLLGFVRSKVGDDITNRLETFSKQLVTSGSSALEAQVTAAANPGVVQVLSALIDTAVGLFGGRRLIFVLEEAQNLGEDDLRALADLNTLLPGGCQLRATYSTYDAETPKRLLALARAGVDEIPLSPLPRPSVEVWLEALLVPRAWFAAIFEATGGYPVHIEEAVALLRRGDSLDGLTRAALTRRMLPSIWQTLTYEAKTAGILVAPWKSPVPSPPEYVDREPAQWSAIETEFWSSRLFTVEVDGRRWFHSIRRQILWDEVLSESDRRVALEHLAKYLVAELTIDQTRTDYMVELAELVVAQAQAGGFGHALQAGVQLDSGQLAVLAAVIELQEAQAAGGPFLNFNGVIDHAREAFGGAGDLTASVQALSEQGLLSMISDPQGVAAILPALNSEGLVPLIRGRAAQELGRLPIPGIATAAMQAGLRPALGDFSYARYGMGHPNWGTLSVMANQLELHMQRAAGGPIHLSSARPFGILLRAEVDGSSLWAAVTYPNQELRNAALERVGVLDLDVAGRALQVHEARAHPSRRVARMQLGSAFERLNAWRRQGEENRSGMVDDVETWVSRHAETFARVADILSPEERVAASLDEGLGLAYAIRGNSWYLAYIQGGSGVTKVSFDQVPTFGQNDMVAIAQILRLPPGQWIVRTNYRGGVGQSDPIKEGLDFVSGHLARFNEQQPSLRIVADLDGLESQIELEEKRVEHLARSLAEIEGTSVRELEPATTYVLIADPQSSGYVPLGNGVAWRVRLSNGGTEHRYRLRWADPSAVPANGVEAVPAMESAFRITLDVEQGIGPGWAMAQPYLARKLGFDHGDVMFAYP